jgi:hypothetical protein
MERGGCSPKNNATRPRGGHTAKALIIEGIWHLFTTVRSTQNSSLA